MDLDPGVWRDRIRLASHVVAYLLIFFGGLAMGLLAHR